MGCSISPPLFTVRLDHTCTTNLFDFRLLTDLGETSEFVFYVDITEARTKDNLKSSNIPWRTEVKWTKLPWNHLWVDSNDKKDGPRLDFDCSIWTKYFCIGVSCDNNLLHCMEMECFVFIMESRPSVIDSHDNFELVCEYCESISIYFESKFGLYSSYWNL